MNQLKDIEKYILYGIVFLLPVVFTTIFPNNFLTPKLILLVAGLAILLILKVTRTINSNQISYSTSKIDVSVLLLSLAFVVSGTLITPNKMEAFFLPGTASVFAASAVLYFVIQQLNKEEKINLKAVILLSGTLVSVFLLIAAAEVLKSIPQLPDFMKSSSFNTLGGSLPTFVFLISLLPLGVALAKEERDMAKKALWGISTALIMFGVLISIFNILPGKTTTPPLAPLSTSWPIAIDTIKSNPVLGIGPGNYLTAFNVFRPLSYNNSDVWQLRFTTPRSILLEITTETGLLGTLGFVLLIFQLSKTLSKKIKEDISVVSLILMFGFLVIFPPSIVLVAFLYVYIAIFSETKNVTNHFSQESKLPTIIVTAPVIIAIALLAYKSYGVVKAEYTFNKALVAANKNQGQTTYNLLREAINTNPYVDRYHASYSQVNLALANSIAASDQITDEQRNTIAQLIQQAIREGKSTVSLNPQRAGNWELLGNIYRSVIPLAEGADSFALQSYNQAVALDPANPNLRILLGGILYGAGNYESAIDVFKLAVRVKPDHANTHYNLAIAYRENKQPSKAKEELSTVLSLVESGSADYKLVMQTLNDIENNVEPTQNEPGGNLTTPQDSNEPVLEPPIELPEDAAPDTTNNATGSANSISSPSPTPLP